MTSVSPQQLAELLASVGLTELAKLPHAVMEVELVLRHGYHKHADNAHDAGPGRNYTKDWKHATEHLHAFRRKRDYDPETGRTNLSHAAARTLWLLAAVLALLLTGCCPRVTPVSSTIEDRLIVRPGAAAGIVLRPEVRWPDTAKARVDTLVKDRVKLVTRYLPGKPVEVQAECPPDSVRTVIQRDVVHVQAPWWDRWYIGAIGVMILVMGLACLFRK